MSDPAIADEDDKAKRRGRNPPRQGKLAAREFMHGDRVRERNLFPAQKEEAKTGQNSHRQNHRECRKQLEHRSPTS